MAVDIIRLVGSALLFCLIFGMSATVEVHSLAAQLKNTKAVGIGLVMQFLFLPFMGFLSVKIFSLDHATGVILLVLTSSPGGSYSNWWCSVFNADLALSVTMTAISTCLSVVLLPANLLMYARFAYGDDLAETLDWESLAFAVLLVIAAVCAGLYASALMNSQTFNLNANRLGNYAGLILIIFSAIISNSHKSARLWDRDPSFYFGIAMPCVVALIVANVVTLVLRLPNAEIVTISIESCYQNVGIAMTVSFAMFYGQNLARAVAVPFYYGLVQAAVTFCYCIVAWKLGWTKAPADVSFWTMISTSYEILSVEVDGEETFKEADGFCYVDHSDSPMQKPGALSEDVGPSIEGRKIV